MNKKIRDKLDKVSITSNIKYSLLHIIAPLGFGIALTILFNCIGFNLNQYDHYLMSVIGIMATSGTILSLGLTVFQSMLSDLARTYNSSVRQFVANRHYRNNSFRAFILTVFLCLTFILLPGHNDLLLSLILSSFVIGLSYFLFALNDISRIKDPSKMIQSMHDAVIKEMQK